MLVARGASILERAKLASGAWWCGKSNWEHADTTQVYSLRTKIGSVRVCASSSMFAPYELSDVVNSEVTICT